MSRAAAVILAFVGTSAAGYILPGGAILRRMATARNDLTVTSLKVEGALTYYGPGVQPAATALATPSERTELTSDGALYIKSSGRCRAEASVPEGTRVAVVHAQGRKRLEGAEIPALSVAIEQVCAILSARAGSDQETRGLVERHLRGLGIDPKVTSLARLGNHVAYVLGDAGEGKPQFWVYKEGFRPARLRYKDTAGTAWDVRFLDYGGSPAGDGMPRNVEVWKGSDRVLRFAAFKGDTRSTLADALFK